MVNPIGAALAMTEMVAAIQAIYNVADNFNDWINGHIKKLKEHENETISRTGKVLEGAKFGFGVGYIAPVVVIAVGQLLLGNPLSAAAAVGSAAILTNPISMTCAAVGAIYYGWNALSDQERNCILDKIGAGLEVGVELIKSIINFVTTKTKKLLSSKQLAEIKEFIRNSAATFGKKLGDITHTVTDKIADTAIAAKDVADMFAKRASYGVIYTTTVASDTALAAAKTAARETKKASKTIVQTASTAAEKAADRGRKVSKSVAGSAIRTKNGITRTLDVNGDGRLNWEDVTRTTTKIKTTLTPKRKTSTKDAK